MKYPIDPLGRPIKPAARSTGFTVQDISKPVEPVDIPDEPIQNIEVDESPVDHYDTLTYSQLRSRVSELAKTLGVPQKELLPNGSKKPDLIRALRQNA